MPKYFVILLCSFSIFLANINAQKRSNNLNDTIKNDTLFSKNDTVIKKEFKPDPNKVVWYGAVIPGLGQIANRKYWKLPIVYGGFLGCAYAYSWNSGKYNDYRRAYFDIIDSDPTTNSFMDLLPQGYTIESIGGISRYTTILKTKHDQFRRYRDLSVIVTVGFYALTLVDAFVDAQLYDFDITPELSMGFGPALLIDNSEAQRILGMQLCLHLK